MNSSNLKKIYHNKYSTKIGYVMNHIIDWSVKGKISLWEFYGDYAKWPQLGSSRMNQKSSLEICGLIRLQTYLRLSFR